MKNQVNLERLRQLRERAMQAIAENRHEIESGSVEKLLPDQQRLIEELSVYQTELELQNQELVESQSAMLAASERYRALFDCLPLPAAVCDEESFIVESNKAFDDFFGIKRSGIDQGYMIGQFLDEVSRIEVVSQLWHAGDAPQAMEFAVTAVLPDEVVVPCKLSLIQLALGGGPSAHNLLVFEDKSIETALGRQALDLERARELAESANRAKSAFLANMSHEIRTPMNAITGFANLLGMTPLSDKQQAHLTKILEASRHLLQLIGNILDLARIESGKMVLDNATFDLRAVVTQVCDMTRDRANEKKLGLAVEFAPDVPRFVVGDALRIRQAVLNYVSNAIKFSHVGTITVAVDLLQRQYSSALIRVMVIDQGVGIPPAARERLFRAFEQADTSLTRSFGGSGLGLAITKQLATMMGGSVGFESIEGQGSRFWFTARLEVAREQEAETAKRIPAPQEPEACRSLKEEFAGKCVLVCDDDEINRCILDELLQVAGLTVFEAENGEEVLSILDRVPVDLILLDMQMPVMNGVECAQHIRQDRAMYYLPIIGVTANVQPEHRTLCVNAGMNDVIFKPFDPTHLYQTILAQFRQGRAA